MSNQNSFKPCAMCQIRQCSKNRNPNPDKKEMTAIERVVRDTRFKQNGCPY